MVLNGWGLGEMHYGGYSQMARVKGDWLIPLPAGLDTAEAMAVGTAGYTAMLALMALERHGAHARARPGRRHRRGRRRRLDGGGRSSPTAATRSHAVTGRTHEADYLGRLGAGGDRRPRRAHGASRSRSARSAGQAASMRSAAWCSPTCSR